MIYHMYPGLDLYHAGPAQTLTTAGEELDDLDHDLSDLCEVCKLSLDKSRTRRFLCPDIYTAGGSKETRRDAQAFGQFHYFIGAAAMLLIPQL